MKKFALIGCLVFSTPAMAERPYYQVDNEPRYTTAEHIAPFFWAAVISGILLLLANDY